MYKLSIKIWFTIVFIGLFCPVFGQNIVISNPISLKTESPINEIYDSYFFDKEIVLLTDSRKNGQLDILIVTLNQNKEVIREEIIGTSEAYDRPIELIKKNNDGYWLCSNSIQNGKRTFTLYELNKTFVPINNKSIPIDNLDEVTATKYDEKNQNFIFTATVVDSMMNMYPRLITYDLTNHKIIQSIDFNNRTDKERPITRKDTVSIDTIDRETNQLVIRGTKVIERYIHHFKECSQIKCLDDNCSEILLIGQESSVNFTDFWVTKVKDNRIVWEKMYKTRLGGDVAMDVFLDKKSKCEQFNFYFIKGNHNLNF